MENAGVRNKKEGKMKKAFLFLLMFWVAAVVYGGDTKVSELAVRAEQIGPDWTGPTGLVIDDIDVPPKTDKETAEIIAGLTKQMKPLGVKGTADFTYNKKNDPMQQVTIKVFQFSTEEQCRQWMKTKYVFSGWEQKYKRIEEKDLTGFDSLETRKRIVFFGKLWITAGTISDSDSHLTVLQLFLERIKKPQSESAAVSGGKPAPKRESARESNATVKTNVVVSPARHGHDDVNAAAWPDLRLVSMRAKPFLLRFTGEVNWPDGRHGFGVSDDENGRTFVHMDGNDWYGFKIAAFEPRARRPGASPSAPEQDTAILVYQRGSKTIRLIRGEAVPYVEHMATVKVVSTGREVEVKESDSFTVATTLYTVAEIDPKAERMRITTAASPTGKWIELSKQGLKPGADR